jgi:hypothetical protein
MSALEKIFLQRKPEKLWSSIEIADELEKILTLMSHDTQLQNKNAKVIRLEWKEGKNELSLNLVCLRKSHVNPPGLWISMVSGARLEDIRKSPDSINHLYRSSTAFPVPFGSSVESLRKAFVDALRWHEQNPQKYQEYQVPKENSPPQLRKTA